MILEHLTHKEVAMGKIATTRLERGLKRKDISQRRKHLLDNFKKFKINVAKRGAGKNVED